MQGGGGWRGRGDGFERALALSDVFELIGHLPPGLWRLLFTRKSMFRKSMGSGDNGKTQRISVGQWRSHIPAEAARPRRTGEDMGTRRLSLPGRLASDRGSYRFLSSSELLRLTGLPLCTVVGHSAVTEHCRPRSPPPDDEKTSGRHENGWGTKWGNMRKIREPDTRRCAGERD